MSGKFPKDSKASLLKTRKESKGRKEILALLYRMATLKLERLKENAYVRVLFYKPYPVTLLKQSSTADIFLGMFQQFSAKQFTKHL